MSSTPFSCRIIDNVYILVQNTIHKRKRQWFNSFMTYVSHNDSNQLWHDMYDESHLISHLFHPSSHTLARLFSRVIFDYLIFEVTAISFDSWLFIYVVSFSALLQSLLLEFSLVCLRFSRLSNSQSLLCCVCHMSELSFVTDMMMMLL